MVVQPPPDKKHTYIFKLYALDSKLDISSGSDKYQVEDAMKDHILEETILTELTNHNN